MAGNHSLFSFSRFSPGSSAPPLLNKTPYAICQKSLSPTPVSRSATHVIPIGRPDSIRDSPNRSSAPLVRLARHGRAATGCELLVKVRHSEHTGASQSLKHRDMFVMERRIPAKERERPPLAFRVCAKAQQAGTTGSKSKTSHVLGFGHD